MLALCMWRPSVPYLIRPIYGLVQQVGNVKISVLKIFVLKFRLSLPKMSSMDENLKTAVPVYLHLGVLSSDDY